MTDCAFRKELSEYSSLDINKIYERMHKLESILGYNYRDIGNLANAMCAIKINDPNSGKNRKQYYNDALAIVGDAVLKTINSEDLYRRGLNKKEITDLRQNLENNETLFRVSNRLSLRDYIFNIHGFYDECSDENRPTYSNHSQYLEAIIGSILFDSGYESCKDWLLNKFYPEGYLDDLVGFLVG